MTMAGIDSVGIVLVGTKADLKDERQVTKKEAGELAAKFGCPYVETSAREGTNIEELFVKSVWVANKSRGRCEEGTVGARFVKGEYSEKYYPTVIDTYNKVLKVDGIEYNLEITDTKGQDEASLLDSFFVVSMEVYVIAFSVTSQRNFKIARVIRDKLFGLAGTAIIGMVLVGTKCDLVDERQVSREEAQAMADEFECPYVETSARLGTNIDELFIKSIYVANKSRGGLDDSSGDKAMCLFM
ncbi:hypothetical protein IWW37_003876 [Coemansia sp. RSA 2050]|nr:hypothetical protein IWW37_003876 [Coemansia sp. RSA 2050]